MSIASERLPDGITPEIQECMVHWGAALEHKTNVEARLQRENDEYRLAIVDVRRAERRLVHAIRDARPQ